ncbi:hypothetical protein CapIbe_020687 [Capra ibex]
MNQLYTRDYRSFTQNTPKMQATVPAPTSELGRRKLKQIAILVPYLSTLYLTQDSRKCRCRRLSNLPRIIGLVLEEMEEKGRDEREVFSESEKASTCQFSNQKKKCEGVNHSAWCEEVLTTK